jgi:hypothetical protein
VSRCGLGLIEIEFLCDLPRDPTGPDVLKQARTSKRDPESDTEGEENGFRKTRATFGSHWTWEKLNKVHSVCGSRDPIAMHRFSPVELDLADRSA